MTTTTTAFSMAERFARLEVGAKSCLEAEELASLEHCWRFWARPSQMAPTWGWSTWLVLAGRGFGKTRLAAEWVREQVEGGCRWITVIGPTAGSVRDVMVEGESGILNVFPAHQRPRYEPSKRRVVFANGAIATCVSAEEPERLRGLQHERVWCDELAAWRYVDEAWDMMKFGLRLGHNPQALVTTTPKPLTILREMLAAAKPVDADGKPQAPTVAVTRGSTFDNRSNLPASFLTQVIERYAGTRLGRQELEGEVLDDADALFKAAWILHVEKHQLPKLTRTVIAIDPAITTHRKSDETGIVVLALGDDGRGYVLADLSGKFTPDEWARKVVDARREFSAALVVAETNRGGDMVEHVLKTLDPHIPFKDVRALKGKGTRAEPVAALYEQGRVSHLRAGAHEVGLRKLEDQMTTWDPRETPDSPDRLDALVWGLTELLCAAPAPTFTGLVQPKRRF